MKREPSSVRSFVKRTGSKAIRDWSSVVIAAVALIISLFSAWDSYKSAKAADASLEIQKLAVQLDERPFLTVSASRDLKACHAHGGACSNSWSQVFIKAAGRTPAFEVHSEVGCGMSSSPSDPPENYLASPVIRVVPPVMYPNDVADLGCEAPPTERFQAFAVHGTVTYKDIFGTPHFTVFCFTDGGDMLADIPKSPDDVYHLRLCQQGNSLN
jgi:hypothetical protein